MTISYGDSFLVEGRVWVFYDAGRTARQTRRDMKALMEQFLKMHPNAQVCIGLGAENSPVKRVD